VLIRTDSGGDTHDILNWLAHPGRRLHYSVGITISDDIADAILTLPNRISEPSGCPTLMPRMPWALGAAEPGKGPCMRIRKPDLYGPGKPSGINTDNKLPGCAAMSPL
jgi:hypothetical protein